MDKASSHPRRMKYVRNLQDGKGFSAFWEPIQFLLAKVKKIFLDKQQEDAVTLQHRGKSPRTQVGGEV